MADPRLQWRQLSQAQPNVSGLLRGAGESLHRAGEAAKGILADYDAGQKAAGDQELARLLASTNDREALTELVNSDAVRGLNLSEDGIRMLNEAQGNRVDWSNTDSIVRDRDGRLVLARNADARTQGTWDDENRARDRLWADDQAIRSANALILNAERDGRLYGDTADFPVEVQNARRQPGEFVRNGDHVFGNADPGQGPVNGNTGPIQASPETVLRLARTLQAEAGNQGAEGMLAVGAVIRNRAAAGRYGEGIDGVIMQPGQFSAWNSENGYAGGEQGQNMNFQPNEEAMAVAQAILSGQYEDPTQGATHYYNPDISQPEWGGRIIENGRVERPTPFIQAESLLVDAGLSAQQINAALNPARTQGEQRSAQVLAAEEQANAEILREMTTAANQAVLSDPNITTWDQLRTAVLADENFTTEENQARLVELQGIIANDPTWLTPQVQGDVRFSNLIEGTAEDISRGIESTVIGRMSRDIEAFSEADSPTDALMDTLGATLEDNAAGPLGAFFSEGGAGADRNDVTNMINRYAQKFRVSPEVAAAAMREAFVDDPTTFIGNANTLENRFDEDRVGEIIAQYTNQENQSTFRDRERVGREFEQRLQTLNSEITTLQQQAAKTTNSSERQRIQERIAAIYVEMSTIRSEAQELYGTR